MESMMEKDILDSLGDLGYKGSIKGVATLKKAVETGIPSTDFTGLIAWLSSELKLLCHFEEEIHSPHGPDDESAFMMELSSFIREMNCPYPTLTDGPIAQRLSQIFSRLELLNYLITELQAARMTVALKKHAISKSDGAESKTQIAESHTATILKAACIALDLPKPPKTITAQQLFSKLTDKVKEQVSKLPKNRVGQPLFIGALNPSQWRLLEQLNDDMKFDYRTRSELLIQRLDVTIQSFAWSDRVKKREDELLRIYRPLRQQLKTTSSITLADLLAARDDMTQIEKTSSVNLRTGTTTTLNKLLIKNIPPDRGGRPREIEPPPPEMPPWQKNRPGGSGHYGGPQQQRQAGGRGSGRVQGGGWQGHAGGGRGAGRQDNYNANNYGAAGGRQDQYGGGYGASANANGGGYQDGYNKGHQQYQQQTHAAGYGNQQYAQYGASMGNYGQPYAQQGGYHQQDQYYGGGGGYNQQQQHYHHRGGGGGGRGHAGGGRGRGGGRGGRGH